MLCFLLLHWSETCIWIVQIALYGLSLELINSCIRMPYSRTIGSLPFLAQIKCSHSCAPCVLSHCTLTLANVLLLTKFTLAVLEEAGEDKKVKQNIMSSIQNSRMSNTTAMRKVEALASYLFYTFTQIKEAEGMLLSCPVGKKLSYFYAYYVWYTHECHNTNTVPPLQAVTSTIVCSCCHFLWDWLCTSTKYSALVRMIHSCYYSILLNWNWYGQMYLTWTVYQRSLNTWLINPFNG